LAEEKIFLGFFAFKNFYGYLQLQFVKWNANGCDRYLCKMLRFFDVCFNRLMAKASVSASQHKNETSLIVC